MAGSSVISLGPGTIILLVMWTITAFIWFFFHRSQNAVRYIVFVIASTITLTLFLLPPDTGMDLNRTVMASFEDEIIYDYMFIWKSVLIMILLLSLIGGMLLNIIEFWAMKVHGSKAIPVSKKSRERNPAEDIISPPTPASELQESVLNETAADAASIQHSL